MTKPHFAIFSYLTYAIENPFSCFPSSFSRGYYMLNQESLANAESGDDT